MQFLIDFLSKTYLYHNYEMLVFFFIMFTTGFITSKVDSHFFSEKNEIKNDNDNE